MSDQRNKRRNVYLIRESGKGKNYPIGETGIKKTPWSESAIELYRPSDRRLSAK
jgi:hypothetical protein